MADFHLLRDPDDLIGTPQAECLGAALLQWAGVQCGRVAAPAYPGASAPRLRLARALVGLQQRFGEADRVHRRQSGPAARPAPRVLQHDEVHLVVAGRCAWLLPVPALGGWLQSTWEPLEWFSLPAGLRYAEPARPGGDGDAPAAERLVLQRLRRPGPPPSHRHGQAQPWPDALPAPWRQPTPSIRTGAFA